MGVAVLRLVASVLCVASPGLLPFAIAQPAESVALPFSCAVEAGKVRLTPGRERAHAILGARAEQVVLACAGGEGGASARASAGGASGAKSCRTLVAHRFEMSCGGRRVAWVDVAAAIGGRRLSRVWIADGRFNLAIISASAGGARGPCATPNTANAGAAQGPADGSDGGGRPCADLEAGRSETHFKMPQGFAPLAHLGARIVPRATAADGPEPEPLSNTPRRIVAAATPAPTAGTIDRRTLERTIITEPLPDVVGSSGRDRARLRGEGEGGVGGEGEARAGNERSAATAGTDIARAPEDIAGANAAQPVSPFAAPGGEAGAGDRARLAARGEAGSAQATGQPAPWTATILPPAEANVTSPLVTGSSRAPDAAGKGPAPVVAWLMLTLLIASGGWLAWMRQAQLQAAVQRIDAQALLATWTMIASRTKSLSRSITQRAGEWLTPLARGASGGTGGGEAEYPSSGLQGVFDRVCVHVARLPADSALGRVLADELGRVRQRLKVAETAGRVGGGETAEPPRIPAAAYRVLMRELLRIERIAEGARESIAAGGGVADPGGRMPGSREEALALLGINPNVDAATVKRVVDALRMSWHPDLAHDEADRTLREARIKQINVAAELLAQQSRPA